MAIDTIFTGGCVLTLTGGAVRTTALAVEKGRIVYLGERVPEALVNESTERVDLGGRTIVPGLIDAHVHLTALSLFRTGIDLTPCESIAEIQRAVAAWRKRFGRSKVVVGWGASPHRLDNGRLPTSKQLDDTAIDRPVIVISRDGQRATVNTALIDSLGDADGELAESLLASAGEVRGQGATSLYVWLSQNLRRGALMRGLLNSTNDAMGEGVTSRHSMETPDFPDRHAVSRARRARLVLAGAVVPFYQVSSPADAGAFCYREVPGAAATVLAPVRRDAADDAILRFAGEMGFASPPRLRPVSIFRETEPLEAWVWQAHRRGYQLSLTAHDRASIEMAIHAIRLAQDRFPRPDARHRIEGCLRPSPRQVEAIADLGIAVCTPPHLLTFYGTRAQRLAAELGEAGQRELLPHRSLLNAGVLWGVGSFGPASEHPLLVCAMQACRHPDPEQRVSPLEALRAITVDAARLAFDEADKGTLALGKRADLAVLSGEPATEAGADIGDLSVDRAFVGGRPSELAHHRASRLWLGALVGRFRHSFRPR